MGLSVLSLVRGFFVECVELGDYYTYGTKG